MALLGKLFGKKDTGTDNCCRACSGGTAAQPVQNEGAAVKVLGAGCKRCDELAANTKEALEQLGMDVSVEHVTDFGQIAAYGVMTTPALVLNGKVVSAGKVLKKEDIIALIRKQESQ